MWPCVDMICSYLYMSVFFACFITEADNRPYAFSYFSWGIPFYSPSLGLENIFKSVNPHSENQYFSTFQISLEPS